MCGEELREKCPSPKASLPHPASGFRDSRIPQPSDRAGDDLRAGGVSALQEGVVTRRARRYYVY